MEAMLQTVIIVFMLFLCSLCLFAVLVIARDMVAESMSRYRKNHNGEDRIVKEVTVIKEVSADKAVATTEVIAQPPVAKTIVLPTAAVTEVKFTVIFNNI